MKITSQHVALAVAILAAFSAGYGVHDRLAIPGAHAAPPVVAETAIAGPRLAAAIPDFTRIVAENGPAVVNISVSGTRRTALPGLEEDSALSEFLRRFALPYAHGDDGRRQPDQAQGSGFIVSPDGTILTNAHVVADADEVIVKLTDKREFKAKLVGMDRATDVAVLRIDADKLPAVRIGDVKKARVGEWVLAIGSPFGFENSVTAGIISAKSRSLPDEGYVPFMQTDVAINPGNSGGPLLNASGEVVGINSQIYSRSGGYQGLSFAIPIDVAMNVEQQLLATGKVHRGRLGVMIQEVDQALADSFGLDRPRGALVASVDADGPAARAGVATGDIILAFNGQAIDRSATLPALVAETRPGSQSSVEVWRHGKTRTLTIPIAEFERTAARTDGHDRSGG